MTDSVALGVDVGADRVHIVGLDAEGTVTLTRVLDPTNTNFHSQLHDLLLETPRRTPVGIDGPGGPSAAAYADDHTVSNKFRFARGCEIELGRQRGIWVSFATGPEVLAGWMAIAADMHRIVEESGRVALETYPYAIFRTLYGSRPPKKTSGAGVTVRAELLGHAGVHGPDFAMWSHDALDAAAAALVALHEYRGTAVAVRSERDGTSIWLPPKI